MLVEKRYRQQRQPAGLLGVLGARGVSVTVVNPHLLVHDLAPLPWLAGATAVVARGRSGALLTALAVAEHFGIPTLNHSSAIAAVRDKAAMGAALVAAGLPAPRTWVGPPTLLARTIGSTAYPLVVKPVFGDNGRGIRLVDGPNELADLPWPEPTAVVQELLPCDGTDLKVYVVGQRMWAVRAPSPLPRRNPLGDGPPRLVPLTAEVAELAGKCGQLFGLELYGVDCLLTPAGPVVVEVNDFPNYSGVPEADDALADLVLRHRAVRR